MTARFPAPRDNAPHEQVREQFRCIPDESPSHACPAKSLKNSPIPLRLSDSFGMDRPGWSAGKACGDPGRIVAPGRKHVRSSLNLRHIGARTKRLSSPWGRHHAYGPAAISRRASPRGRSAAIHATVPSRPTVAHISVGRAGRSNVHLDRASATSANVLRGGLPPKAARSAVAAALSSFPDASGAEVARRSRSDGRSPRESVRTIAWENRERCESWTAAGVTLHDLRKDASARSLPASVRIDP